MNIDDVTIKMAQWFFDKYNINRDTQTIKLLHISSIKDRIKAANISLFGVRNVSENKVLQTQYTYQDRINQTLQVVYLDRLQNSIEHVSKLIHDFDKSDTFILDNPSKTEIKPTKAQLKEHLEALQWISSKVSYSHRFVIIINDDRWTQLTNIGGQFTPHIFLACIIHELAHIIEYINKKTIIQHNDNASEFIEPNIINEYVDYLKYQNWAQKDIDTIREVIESCNGK